MHTQERGTCRSCGRLVTADSPSIPGTMFGEKSLGFITEYAGRKNTDGDIAAYFTNMYGFGVSPNAIWNARQASTALLEKTYRYIMEELKAAKFIGMDESPFRIGGILGQVWLARSDTATFMIMTTNRRKENLTDHFSDLFMVPVVVDGHKSYETCFMIIQRCWAHILRKAEDLAMSGGEDSPEYGLHKDLSRVLHDAKQVAASAESSSVGGAVADACVDLKNRVLEIATLYGNHEFAGHLRRAAPHLFTFLKYPGMPPTNNAAEGDIRDGVVIERKIRQKMVNAKGMHVFSVIHSFTQTCRKLRLVPWKEIVNIARDPDWNIFDEARRRQNTVIQHVPDRTLPQLPAPPEMPQLPAPPEMPQLPAPPEMPQLPAPPEMPQLPAPPEMPQLPAPPEMPQLPAPPEMPQLPAPPEMPQLPAPPEMPQLPAPPEMPQLPAPPEMPQLPAPPEMPQLPAPPEMPQLPASLQDSDPTPSGNTKPVPLIYRITLCMILTMLGVTWHEKPVQYWQHRSIPLHAKTVRHHISYTGPPPGVPPPEPTG